MSGRINNAILNSSAAFAQGNTAPMVDPQYGGQMGHSVDLDEWVSNASYVRKNLVAVLMEAPKGFQYLPNPEYWVGTLRSMLELHAITIDGLASGLTVEVAENPVGGAGEMQQDPTNVTRERSQPVITINEKYGMPFANFLMGWIRNLIMDPDSKFAAVNTFGTNRPGDMLPDMYAGTVLFYEPDPQHQRVVKAWLCTNFYPLGTGEIIGRRDITAAGETSSPSINFSAITQQTLGVKALAQEIMNGINITGANPYLRNAFIDKVSNQVLATKKSYQRGLEDISADSVAV